MAQSVLTGHSYPLVRVFGVTVLHILITLIFLQVAIFLIDLSIRPVLQRKLILDLCVLVLTGLANCRNHPITLTGGLFFHRDVASPIVLPCFPVLNALLLSADGAISIESAVNSVHAVRIQRLFHPTMGAGHLILAGFALSVYPVLGFDNAINRQTHLLVLAAVALRSAVVSIVQTIHCSRIETGTLTDEVLKADNRSRTIRDKGISAVLCRSIGPSILASGTHIGQNINGSQTQGILIKGNGVRG